MVLRAIESRLKSGFHDDVMRIVQIEPLSQLNELVLANQKVNKIEFTGQISFENLKYLGKQLLYKKTSRSFLFFLHI